MDADGTRDGFDLELIRAVRAAVDVPVIASGGAGAARATSRRPSRPAPTRCSRPACSTSARCASATSRTRCGRRRRRCAEPRPGCAEFSQLVRVLSACAARGAGGSLREQDGRSAACTCTRSRVPSRCRQLVVAGSRYASTCRAPLERARRDQDRRSRPAGGPRGHRAVRVRRPHGSSGPHTLMVASLHQSDVAGAARAATVCAAASRRPPSRGPRSPMTVTRA